MPIAAPTKAARRCPPSKGTPTIVGRLAASRVLTRPNVTDSAPCITVSTDAPTASGGNPQFVPFLATQVDGSLDGNFSVRATEQVTFSLEGVNLAGARQYAFDDSPARFGESIYYGWPLPSPAPRPPLRMNEVQVISSHNSFKTRIPDAVLAAIRARAPQDAEALDYDHLPLTAQLDRGGHDDRVRPRGDTVIGVQGLSHPRYRLSVGLHDLSPVSEGNRHMVARASRTSADHDHHQRRRHTVRAGGDQRPAAAAPS